MPEYPTPGFSEDGSKVYTPYPTDENQYAHHYDAEDVSRPRHYTIAPHDHPDFPYAHEVRRVIGHDKSTRVLKYKTLELAQTAANALNALAENEL